MILEEIQSQGEVWASVTRKSKKVKKDLLDILRDCSHLYFIGSGSSYHTGLIAGFAYNELFDKKSTSIPSSEFLFYSSSYLKTGSKSNVFILISRTGETSDTLLAAGIIKKMGGYVIALTAFPGTKITKKSDYQVVLEECQEQSITSTRAVSGFTAFLLNLFSTLSGKKGSTGKLSSACDGFLKGFKSYSDILCSIVNKGDFNKYVFLGHGPFYGIAREAALKTKEMSITNTEFWRTLEYRHGHNTIIDKNSLMVLYLSEKGIDYEVKACRELRKAGAKVLIICDRKDLKKLEAAYDHMINIKLGLEESLQQVYYQVFGQLIGYYQAKKKGIDPSDPKYLDFVITI